VISTPATNLFPPPLANAISAKEKNNREDERSLIQRAQRNDEEAFATLFQLHKNRVYSVCLLMTKDIAEAEDLTQEAFLQVFRSVGSFRCDSAFSTWAYRIAVNTVVMNLRRRKIPTISLDEPVSSESPSLRRDIGRTDLRLGGAIDRIALRRAMQELPAGCRRIFALHEVEGYQHHEIAKMLDCSVGNSKSQLHKARMKMRGLLLPKRRVLRRAADNIKEQEHDGSPPKMPASVVKRGSKRMVSRHVATSSQLFDYAF
jgi:RNA polymerase sigma-70 factor (ECF subfamily)